MRQVITVGAAVVALVIVAPALDAQTEERPRIARQQREKSPTLARVIGIVPGLGHVYAGQSYRGLGWFGATLGVAAVGGSISDAQCRKPEEEYTDEHCSSETIDIITAVATAGVWIWSIVDAGWTAERTNLRRRRFPLDSRHGHLFVARGTGGGDALRVGVRLTTP